MSIRVFSLALLPMMSGCVNRDHDGAELPVLHAVHDDGGVLVWTEAPLPGGIQVEVESTTGWVALAVDGSRWVDASGTESTRYRTADQASGDTGAPIQPEPLSFELLLSRPLAVLTTGDTLAITPTTDAVSAWPEVSATATRTVGSEVSWLDGPCVATSGGETCWSAEEASLGSIPDAASFQAFPEITAAAAGPTLLRYEATLTAMTDDGPVTLATATAEVVDAGRRLVWGDLHGHTNLSHDGCEDPDRGCADRGTSPGAAYFPTAIEAGWDFTAITDHAEYVILYPTGDEDGPSVNTWQAAQYLVADAARTWSGGVPILGYEWTYAAATETTPRKGGHRHVIFEATEACEAWRVAADVSDDPYAKPSGTQRYVTGNHYVARNPEELWSLLHEAQATCPTDRVLVVPHHTAMIAPEGMDWAWSENEPDYEFMSLMEIASEHGVSECEDLADDDCNWNIDDEGYLATGSIRTALGKGYVLGFAGGTDAHDGQPGSLDDGGSCSAHWVDPDGDGEKEPLQCATYDGAVTGALVAGTLDRTTLFDALFARNTLVTTGPRVDLGVAALSADGRVFLPGDRVPAAAGPYTLRVSASTSLAALGAEPLALEFFGKGDAVLAAIQGEGDLEAVVDLPAGEVAYLRARVSWNGEEARLWASPFFSE